MLFSVKPQHESAIGIHMSPPSWTSLSPPNHPTPLGCHRALSWAPCVTQQISMAYLILHLVVHMFQCCSLNLSHPLLPLLGPQVCISTAALQIGSSVPPFKIPYICVITQYWIRQAVASSYTSLLSICLVERSVRSFVTSLEFSETSKEIKGSSFLGSTSENTKKKKKEEGTDLLHKVNYSQQRDEWQWNK